MFYISVLFDTLSDQLMILENLERSQQLMILESSFASCLTLYKLVHEHTQDIRSILLSYVYYLTVSLNISLMTVVDLGINLLQISPGVLFYHCLEHIFCSSAIFQVLPSPPS